MSEALPIEGILPELRRVMAERGRAVLVAAPGAGKTTRVPLALLGESWLEGGRVLMLEPRRLAARMAARYMAGLLGEEAGGTVGYRTRQDSRVGPYTRIEVITEGVLTRMLQQDPSLEGVRLVIFDEFHERSLQADLGLALCLQSAVLFREDLRLLVMSATLEAEPVAALLGGAPVLISEGRSYPVETLYRNEPVRGRIEPAVVAAVEAALNHMAGDVLVFLPGAGEIRRVAALLAEKCWGDAVRVAPLYGNLTAAEQDLALLPSPPGQRKVVLATSIAETSLTVEGVSTVVDAGLARRPRFSPRTGMTRLETMPVSRAAADQRRGRAGRLGPGVCWRLWTLREDAQREERGIPEIMEADLAPLALELAEWGVNDVRELQWLDAPPPAALAQARDLLRRLGALDDQGCVTPTGRKMAAVGIHPRLARMILTAQSLGAGGIACDLAAVLEERDFLRTVSGPPDPDLRLRLEVLAGTPGDPFCGAPRYRVDTAACRRIRETARKLRRSFSVSGGEGSIEDCGWLLGWAFPDRIAQLREPGRFLLANGRGATLFADQSLAAAPYLVAAELDDQGTESRIFLAAPLLLVDLRRHWDAQIVTEERIWWDAAAQIVRTRIQERLGALILKESAVAVPDREACRRVMLAAIRENGLDMLPWNKATEQLRLRLACMSRWCKEWSDWSETGLLTRLEELLEPYLDGITGWAQLQQLCMKEILLAALSWEQRRQLDAWAPEKISVPSGRDLAVDYRDPDAPVLAVRLQEVFGLNESPRVAGGRLPLVLHLLSPAQRPVQVTRDLANFWRTTYFEVKKDLQGRYPKHYWPDDPAAAVPTNRVRPRTP